MVTAAQIRAKLRERWIHEAAGWMLRETGRRVSRLALERSYLRMKSV